MGGLARLGDDSGNSHSICVTKNGQGGPPVTSRLGEKDARCVPETPAQAGPSWEGPVCPVLHLNDWKPPAPQPSWGRWQMSAGPGDSEGGPPPRSP